jgi:hypothetical protein
MLYYLFLTVAWILVYTIWDILGYRDVNKGDAKNKAYRTIAAVFYLSLLGNVYALGGWQPAAAAIIFHLSFGCDWLYCLFVDAPIDNINYGTWSPVNWYFLKYRKPMLAYTPAKYIRISVMIGTVLAFILCAV